MFFCLFIYDIEFYENKYIENLIQKKENMQGVQYYIKFECYCECLNLKKIYQFSLGFKYILYMYQRCVQLNVKNQCYSCNDYIFCFFSFKDYIVMVNFNDFKLYKYDF